MSVSRTIVCVQDIAWAQSKVFRSLEPAQLVDAAVAFADLSFYPGTGVSVCVFEYVVVWPSADAERLWPFCLANLYQFWIKATIFVVLVSLPSTVCVFFVLPCTLLCVLEQSYSAGTVLLLHTFVVHGELQECPG